MPASRFLKIVQETGQIPVCTFYLPVSTSRNSTVDDKLKVKRWCQVAKKHDDDVSTIPPNPVRESIFSMFSLFCWRETAFPYHQVAHGLPPPLSHPDFLECLYLSHETVLSVSA